ncbi:acyl-CoA N-acyltransferase [Fomes fomentarius]|nr:acyl-CoA N-acyltransferase [Fomes fomentarius]
MRALVEPSSFGWDPEDKKAELFDDSSRFIMVHHRKDSQVSQSTLVAFSMFRFELGDEDEDSVYCYELQVVEGYRGYGLGQFFVDKLTRIRKHWKMEKILLTCLKTNVSARLFYGKTGFVLYTGSPEYDGPDGDETYDYEVLSKS